MDIYQWWSMLVNFGYSVGNGLQLVGAILVARYVYGFLFTDEFEPSEKVVKYAKLGFVLLVVGYCLNNLFSASTLLGWVVNRL